VKLQRLTALDISILAKEIGAIIIGKTIEEIRQKSDGVYFYFDGICIGLKIFGNSPYFVLEKSSISGRPWFSRIFGSRIETVNQVNFDRLICFEISLYDRLGQ
jgi:predicted ribosome quality control (RQC) complex YloA/Tae2 family protein